MAYFPMFIQLEAAPCLVVGGGHVALRKVRKLLPYGAKLRVVAPRFLPELERLGAEAGLELLCRKFEPGDLPGSVLVIAATGDRSVNREIAALCRESGIPVNAVDDKEACSFLFPALVRRGPLSIGISTGGASPSAAVSIKERIEACLPVLRGEDGTDRFGEILRYLDSVRPRVKASIGEEGLRAKVFSALFDACMELGRPLAEEEYAALIGRLCGNTGAAASGKERD